MIATPIVVSNVMMRMLLMMAPLVLVMAMLVNKTELPNGAH